MNQKSEVPVESAPPRLPKMARRKTSGGSI
jgi:hypothetical protein